MPSQFFNSVIDENEEILWTDTPIFIPFVLPNFLLGLPILGFVIFLSNNSHLDIKFQILDIGLIIFALAISFRKIFIFNNTAYACTAYRILIRGGFFGTDFISIDYDSIINMEVNVNPIESLTYTGSIRFYSGKIRNTTYGPQSTYDAFQAIRNPYDVFNNLKRIALDARRDNHFHNSFRPRNNYRNNRF